METIIIHPKNKEQNNWPNALQVPFEKGTDSRDTTTSRAGKNSKNKPEKV